MTHSCILETHPFPVAFLVNLYYFLLFTYTREIYHSPFHHGAPSPVDSILFSLFSQRRSTLNYSPNKIVDA